MNKISKWEAKKSGLRFYFSGIPCKNNQTANRRVSDHRCQCEPCLQENRNRDQERKGRKKRYYTEDPGKFKERSRNWRKNNPDKYREMKSDYRESNRASINKHHANRRARKLNATPSWYGELDEFVLVQAYELCQLREQCTGFPWQIDHMIPLQAKNVCGLHVWNNFQVIPASLNLSKGNKMLYTKPHEWLGVV